MAPSDEAVSALVSHMTAAAAFAASVGDDSERVVSRMVAPLGEELRAEDGWLRRFRPTPLVGEF